MTKTFTLLCEGIVEQCFIPAYLTKLGSEKQITFSRSRLALARSSNPSKSKVFKHIKSFALQSLNNLNNDLFIAGVDLDENDLSDELDKHNLELGKLKRELPKEIESKKVILFVSIQAFDYWVLYQKYKIEVSKKKPSNNSLESKSKDYVKRTLYGTSSPNETEIRKVAEQILTKVDFEELSKQSRSFNKFHLQVKEFIRSI